MIAELDWSSSTGSGQILASPGRGASPLPTWYDWYLLVIGVIQWDRLDFVHYLACLYSDPTQYCPPNEKKILCWPEDFLTGLTFFFWFNQSQRVEKKNKGKKTFRRGIEPRLPASYDFVRCRGSMIPFSLFVMIRKTSHTRVSHKVWFTRFRHLLKVKHIVTSYTPFIPLHLPFSVCVGMCLYVVHRSNLAPSWSPFS